MTAPTLFDVLPDPLFISITEFSHQSLVGVSKTLTQRYRYLHAKTDPEVIGDLLVDGLTKGFSYKVLERLRALSVRVFALHLNFGARSQREYPSCENLRVTLSLFPHLREIRLRGKYVNNYYVEEVLENCPHLHALSIRDSDQVTARLATLIRCLGDDPLPAFLHIQTKLRCLQVSNCKNFNATIMLAPNAPTFERVEITGYRIDGYNNYALSGDWIGQFCDRPKVRYVKLSHFYRIDAIFRDARARNPHLIVTEERVSMARRCVYKTQDALRSRAIEIMAVVARSIGTWLLEKLE